MALKEWLKKWKEESDLGVNAQKLVDMLKDLDEDDCGLLVEYLEFPEKKGKQSRKGRTND